MITTARSAILRAMARGLRNEGRRAAQARRRFKHEARRLDRRAIKVQGGA